MLPAKICIFCCHSWHIDGLLQDHSKSITNTLELLQSCSKPSIYISISPCIMFDYGVHKHVIYWRYWGCWLWYHLETKYQSLVEIPISKYFNSVPRFLAKQLLDSCLLLRLLFILRHADPCRVEFILQNIKSYANLLSFLNTEMAQVVAFVNSLAPGKFEWNFRHLIFQIISVIDGWVIARVR